MTPQHLNRIKLLPDKYLFAEKLLKFSQPFENMIHSHKANSDFKDYTKDDSSRHNHAPSLTQFFGKAYPAISEKIEKMRNYQNFTSHLDGSMNSFDLSLLLRQALTQIPQIPFAYILDIFRWDLFSGDVSFDDANKYFWKLANDEQGIHTPDHEDRTNFFDAGAKYHIADNTPYVRCLPFIGILLCVLVDESNNQMQFQILFGQLHSSTNFPWIVSGNCVRRIQS